MSRHVSIALAVVALLFTVGNFARAEVAAVGQPAPQFTATDTKGTSHDLAALTKAGKIVVLEWFNPQCPYDQRHYRGGALNELVKKFDSDKVVWLAVSSTHNLSADELAKSAGEWHIAHPILMDQSGKIGHLYGAKTTPHMFIINTEGTLVYNGALDNDPRGDKGADTVNYVEKALNELLAGKTVTTAETRPYGCSVKYGKPQAAAPAHDSSALACGCDTGSTEKPKDKEKEKPASAAPAVDSPALACGCDTGSTEKPKDKEKEKPVSAAPAVDSPALACGCDTGSTEKPKDKEKEKPASAAPAVDSPALACGCDTGSTEKPKDKEKEKPAA